MIGLNLRQYDIVELQQSLPLCTCELSSSAIVSYYT
jgi:hypothetical protein